MKLILPALPLLLGFILDSAVGDPYNIPHPVKLIGNFISLLEKAVRKNMKNLRLGGTLLALAVISLSTVIPLILISFCYRLNTIIGILTETVLCCYMLSARCLLNESMKVYKTLESGDTEKARQAVSMIVGRDTDVLDRDGIIRATVETVAENTSDGVTAPLFFMGLGGATGGFFYKAVNTLDSMIGYKDEKYADIGRFSAKFDDVLNFLPSRATALIMTVSARISGFDGKNSLKIWRRDRRNHASPNSAQTESACAGALHIRLAGDAWYFGKLCKKKYIGDNDRPVEAEDIKRANKLMYCTSAIMLTLSVIFRIIVFGVIL